jgi:hypothetical protein
MAWVQDDVFECPNPRCAAEVIVTRPPKEGRLEALRVVCGCGDTMRKKTKA